MKNLKIGVKLLITFGVIIAMFLITVISAVTGLRSTGRNFSEFYENDYPVSIMSAEMAHSTQTGLKAMAASMLVTDPQLAQSYVNEANTQLNSLPEGLAFLKTHYNGDKSLLTQMESIMSRTPAIRAQVLELSAQGHNDEAIEIFFNDYAPLMQEVEKIMEDIQASAESLAEENSQSSTQLQGFLLAVLVLIAVVALVVTLIMALSVTKSLTAPIKEIEQAASDMAAGKLDVKVNYVSQDELGVLSDKIRMLTQTLKEIISDEDYLLSEMADGRFDIKTRAEHRYIGDFAALLASIRRINTSLSDTLAQINQASDQVASGSDQVSAGAQALSQGATEQASSVQELSATISEISEKVKENAGAANEVSNQANVVGEEINASYQQMQELITAMHEISESSEQIRQISDTIENISFQTNILSLNAAVEAARVGVAGKGFAVVAEEVRSLAIKSAEAAKDTASLIQNSLASVERGTHLADSTAKSLTTVVEGAAQITATINHISDASTEQSDSISQVAVGIDQISSVVQTNSATAEESAATSEELSSQAQLLKELVARFRLKNSSGAPARSAYTAASEPSYDSSSFSMDYDGGKY
ncbi:MAG: methyl-accepting chemotaxis protein [Oscillospiraceae bacterium]|nr:methyl-accepting chemotaxis protein [Oscillospiraceae bacterium]